MCVFIEIINECLSSVWACKMLHMSEEVEDPMYATKDIGFHVFDHAFSLHYFDAFNSRHYEYISLLHLPVLWLMPQ